MRPPLPTTEATEVTRTTIAAGPHTGPGRCIPRPASLRAVRSARCVRSVVQKRRRRDLANAEVIGFVLMFGIAAVAVDFALQTMLTARDAADHLSAFASMSQVADTMANHVTRVSTAASLAPNATFASLLTLPQGPGGAAYTVTIESTLISVDSDPLDSTVTRELPALDEVRVMGEPLQIEGTVSDTDGVVAVEYRWDLGDPADPTDDRPIIELKDM